jgi:hypothetical protein
MIRVGFIHESLLKIHDQLKQIGSSLVKKGETATVFKALAQELISKKCSSIKIMSSMP